MTNTSKPQQPVDGLPPCCTDETSSLIAFAEKLAEVAAVPGGGGTISLNMADAGKLARAFLAALTPSRDTRGHCVDWEWAEGKRPMRCRRQMSCGAATPDACPLASPDTRG